MTHYPIRDAIRDYFPLPNEIFSMGLTGGEILVYAYLMFCEDRKTYTCYPSYRTIGQAVGMSRNTVRKYVESLERKGFITTEYTTVTLKNGIRRNGTMRYHIRPIAEAIQAFYERQMSE